jgi:ABC-type transport system involved in multi-copper enzyme maturation permease subunit
MIELMRKDFRIYRPAFIAAAVAMWVPLLIVAGGPLIRNANMPYGLKLFLSEDYEVFVWVLVVVVAAIFGGMSFAVERRDRSAEFLAMLPASRWDVACSKLVLSAIILVPWLSNLALFVAVERALPRYSGPVNNQFEELCAFLVVTGGLIAAAFGISLLLGQFIKSPAIAACAGLAFVFLVIFSMGELRELELVSPAQFQWLIFIVNLVAGVLGVVAGVWICMRRVSP